MKTLIFILLLWPVWAWADDLIVDEKDYDLWSKLYNINQENPKCRWEIKSMSMFLYGEEKDKWKDWEPFAYDSSPPSIYKKGDPYSWHAIGGVIWLKRQVCK